MEFVFAVDDEGETISKIDIDTEAYTGEVLSCSENPLLDGAQRKDLQNGAAPDRQCWGLTLTTAL